MASILPAAPKQRVVTLNGYYNEEIEVPKFGKVTLRTMELRDIASCFRIGDEVFSLDPSATTTLFRTWNQYDVVEAYNGSKECCMVACHGDTLCGFLLGSIIEKKSNLKYGYVTWIVVAQNFRRKGLGTALLTKVTDIMHGLGVNVLLADTPKGNTSARCFFSHHHFEDPMPHVYFEKKLIQTETKDRTELPDFTERNEVKYRMMDLGDLYAVFNLGESLFVNFSNLDRFWDEQEVMDLFETDAEFCVVAEYESKIVGFALGTTLEKKTKSGKLHLGYLIWLGVSRDVQGKGVGRTLYTEFENRVAATGVNFVMLDTQEENVPAIKFFEVLGFSPQIGGKHVYFAKTLK